MEIEELDRFIDRQGPDDCWPWTRGKTSGYGSVRYQGRSDYVHRLIYARANGPIPDGLVVDHECHNRAVGCANNSACLHRSCQNPAHMQLTTRGQNRANAPIAGVAAVHAAQTHCISGHELIGVNLKPGKQRTCRICARAANSRYEARRRKGQMSG